MEFDQPIAYTRGELIHLDPSYPYKLSKTPMMFLPQKSEDQVQRIFIGGPPGCGKTNWCSKYLSFYNDVFPDSDIWVFSRKDWDPVFEGIENLNYFPMDKLPEYDQQECLEDFKDTCVVFDDIDTIVDPNIQKLTYKLMADLIKAGRDHGIFVLSTNHKLRDKSKTNDIVMNASHIVLFPKSNRAQVHAFLKEKLKLPLKLANKICELPGRWICIHQNAPNLVISEHNIFPI